MSSNVGAYARNTFTRGLARLSGTSKMSLDALKDAFVVLQKYTESALHTEADNRQLVEALRGIAEILIWGDQNDQAVFEYVKNGCYRLLLMLRYTQRAHII